MRFTSVTSDKGDQEEGMLKLAITHCSSIPSVVVGEADSVLLSPLRVKQKEAELIYFGRKFVPWESRSSAYRSLDIEKSFGVLFSLIAFL